MVELGDLHSFAEYNLQLQAVSLKMCDTLYFYIDRSLQKRYYICNEMRMVEKIVLR
jgi:hypothetical protein